MAKLSPNQEEIPYGISTKQKSETIDQKLRLIMEVFINIRWAEYDYVPFALKTSINLSFKVIADKMNVDSNNTSA